MKNSKSNQSRPFLNWTKILNLPSGDNFMHSTRLYRPLSSVFIVANKRFGPEDKTGDKGVAKNPAFSLSHSSSDSEVGI